MSSSDFLCDIEFVFVYNLYKPLSLNESHRTSPVPIQTFSTFSYLYAGRVHHHKSKVLVMNVVFAPSLQARPLQVRSIDAAVFTLCYRLLICSHQFDLLVIELQRTSFNLDVLHTASTYNITGAVGYMLHGSLVLP
jgi:hypothetical protein